MQKKRMAKCACGLIEITLQGDPEFVAACNCIECQRRTGSVFGVGAYFINQTIISKSENTGIYVRCSDSENELRLFFCHHCGSTVWWQADFLPGLIGIAVGCFGDPEFPSPQVTAWSQTKHS